MDPLQASSFLPNAAAAGRHRFLANAAHAKGVVNRLRKPGALDPIRVDPAAAPPAGKLDRLLARDPVVRQAWTRTGGSTGANSREVRDRTLALAAGQAGWSDQEIADLLAAAHRTDETPLAPATLEARVRETLGAARKQLAEDRALREVASQFAGVFLGQFLKAMRETVDTGEFGHGGSEEQTFQAMLDSQMAEDAARSNSYGLSDLIYQSLTGRRGGRLAATVPYEAAGSGPAGAAIVPRRVDVNA